MQIKQLNHAGWERNLQLSNDKAELIISLDVGPRILSYKTPKSENVLKTYPEQLGKQEESEWMIRGGHRLWIAPEDEVLTYVPDNVPVEYQEIPSGVRLANSGVDPWKIKKEMTVTLAEDTSEVTILHRAINEGSAPIEIASWGLSVMIPGGLEIIPHPPLGVHPRDLLPNRLMIVWPYTNLTDPRWRFGESFITLRQTATAGQPTKLGLAHKQKWIGYLTRDSLFIKTIEYQEGAVYPDMGCNFETFTNQDMLEIESLSPLKKLAPGESVSHTERWHLFGEIPEPHSLQEAELAAWLAPFLKEAGL